MPPRDLFGVFVRLLGLSLILAGILYFASGIYVAIDPHAAPNRHVYQYFGTGGIILVLGIYFLRGASHIIDFAYPKKLE